MFNSLILKVIATSTNSTNSFNLSGFVAVNANICNFEKSSVARFPLSISRTETNGDKNTRKSALVNCECWRKSEEASTFELLKKGKLVQVSGFIRPEEWTSEDGTKHNRIVFVATSVSELSTEKKAGERQGFQKESGMSPLIPLSSKDGCGRLFFCSQARLIPFIILRIPLVCHPYPFLRT